MTILYPSMEWKAFQNKQGSSFLWLLVLSTIFLLFILHSSNPFTIIEPKKGLNQGSPLLGNDTTAMPRSSDHEHLNQSWPHSPHNNSTTLLSSSNSSGIPHKEIHNQSLAPFKDGKEEVCDLFAGKWVKEPRGSIYTNSTCPTLPDMRNCGKYGKDQGYVYWKWKPDGCELRRFDPKVFLSIVHGKKLALIGDSLARNQMESLLCLLSQEETPKDIYKDATGKFRTWYFPSHDFTLMVMWTEFLVEGTEIIINGTASNTFNIHLDRMNTIWAEKLPELHYAVISGGNWFSRKTYVYEGGKLLGCVHCKEKNITNLSVAFGIRRIFQAAFQFISRCKECDDLLTLLRTYSMSHFEHGSWFNGGYCNKTQPLNDSDISLNEEAWEFRKIQLEELERIKEEEREGKRRFELLDVTKAMMLRADGHPGSYWIGMMKHSNDCLHWCLPGPIDMWNDLLLETLQKNSLHH